MCRPVLASMCSSIVFAIAMGWSCLFSTTFFCIRGRLTIAENMARGQSDSPIGGAGLCGMMDLALARRGVSAACRLLPRSDGPCNARRRGRARSASEILPHLAHRVGWKTRPVRRAVQPPGTLDRALAPSVFPVTMLRCCSGFRLHAVRFGHACSDSMVCIFARASARSGCAFASVDGRASYYVACPRRHGTFDLVCIIVSCS